MKLFLPFSLLVAGMLSSGCAHHRHRPPQPAPARTAAAPMETEPIVTPDTSLTAKVVAYNSVGRFVVLGFPVGQMPKNGQTFFLYRAGLKVGEVKITGPERDNNIVADLVSGEAQPGDEVRDQ
jgi:hypothetical protein